MTFQPEHVALQGRHLIEASAGTGKTYSIANLFLRLLLEPHPSQADGSPLKVDQILVVTFTNAATDELRGRIRSKIEDALQYFRGGHSEDGFIVRYRQTCLQDEAARSKACELLYRALLLVDDAAIFTIHGFAARAIRTFLFETGSLADAEVNIGGSEAEARYLDDMIRLLSLGPQQFLGNILAAQGLDTRKYITGLNRLLKRACVTLLKSEASLDSVMAEYDSTRERLLEERKNLAAAWTAIDVNAGKKEYEPIRNALVDSFGGDVKSGDITYAIKFCNGTFHAGCGVVKATSGYFGKIYQRGAAAQLTGQALQIFSIIRNVIAFNENEAVIESATVSSQSALMTLLEQRKLEMDLSELQPDDVIQLINKRLDEPDSAALLRRVLTEQYPVCMVDEFQDTDPDQFRLFDRLYQDADTRGLFAIGDPKQSIYAFRGADVFAYLDVKAGIAPEGVHTLDVNFRSRQGVMEGVNALFREAPTNQADKPVFVYPGIQYEGVYSCEQPPEGRGLSPQSRGVYRVGDQVPASLVFVGNEAEESETFNNTVPHYARDCAERILSLLQGEARATVEKKGETRFIRPGDIAILVRDYGEANALKKALRKKRLSAVYLSQKDSVFRCCVFARDLLFILRAMDEPASLYHLKAAFATPLLRHFKTGTALLDALDDDNGFEQAIQQFTAYCQCWEQKGIFSALYTLFAEQGLAEVFAALPDCDRLVTDFRHLGDLLQQQYLLSGSRERLIDWYASQLIDDAELDEDAKSLRLESDDNLVRIVTLHGCKGLEYPVVFMPFFFGFKDANLAKDPPFYHRSQAQGKWEAVLDFQTDREVVQAAMCRERMAEDMRLLYVGITRAIYQCYIGISRSHTGRSGSPSLPNTCWAHLLGLDESDTAPDWNSLKTKLQQRMQDAPCAYEVLCEPGTQVFDVTDIIQAARPLMEVLPTVTLPVSSWQVTSYSALAYQKDTRVGWGSKQDETVADRDEKENGFVDLEDDARWQQNIRYRLPGGTNTGDCLHKVFERLADGDELAEVLDTELRAFGLAKPEGRLPEGAELNAVLQTYQQHAVEWLQSAMSVALGQSVPALQDLFAAGCALPECHFDFSLGADTCELDISAINQALQSACGASAGIARKDRRTRIHGIMTGSIDLLFIHEKKVYVLDYKSNTLGKAPRCYDQRAMQHAMRESRYDLQYLIYSVAAHRYMCQRLGERYDFDGGEYRFGGVFYLFLRGMGLPDYPDHGVYFTRPARMQIEALDTAFAGKAVNHV